VIIVGGTNGKGSTCAYLENIIAAPATRSAAIPRRTCCAYNERVRLNGRPVERRSAVALRPRSRRAQQAGNVALTYFEFGTLAAWEVFADAGVEADRSRSRSRRPARCGQCL
jgi:dihydrofolate synthase/folylpolyglutamate synthase